ncbi:ester cyclase [Leifsonia sp. fls2-241-R2A-40a]|uniref:ester cyclase n=1 Tax=Leifsonia sp. fls2-241-R2A-40a TaxID=3040290 RepID=UPI00254C6A08|nr:ester cyclase [Leifsonia sp. fls2-241-R2A-40a]
MPDADQLRQAYKNVIAAVEADDADALAARISPHIVDHSGIPDQPPGAAGVIAWMHGMHESLSGLRGVVEDIVVEGDRVAARMTWTGTHTGSLVGLPATGKHVTLPAMHLLRFEDGVAAEWWGVPDLYGALVGLGVTFELPPT